MTWLILAGMTAQRGGARVWLEVPYAEKDQAKQLGARWDPTERRWYAGPRARPELHTRWAALPELPEVLPGEDRTFGAGLHPDMIPATTWFSNVRSSIDAQDWQRLRRMLHRRAGGQCELCGRGDDPGGRGRLDAHERFAYDEAAGTQVLRRLVLVCPACHEAIHYGLAQVRGREEAAFAHLRAVTGFNQQAADALVAYGFTRWRSRSRRAWELDLSLLTAARDHRDTATRGPRAGPSRP